MAELRTHQSQARILVLGGIASGKSTVAKVFSGLGAAVVEADAIGRQILDPGGSAFEDVTERWPHTLRNGAIDRDALALSVFNDVAQLRELEAITHPIIREKILGCVAEIGSRPVVVELPLLIELLGIGWTRVVVDADEETRAYRRKMCGFDSRDTRARISAQPAREDWLAAADYVITNSGSIVELERAATALWEQIMATVR